MVGTAIQSLSVLFTIATGSGASLSAFLFWRVFRRSPLGPIIAAIAIIMGVVTAYHGALIIAPDATGLPIVGGLKYVALGSVLALLVTAQLRSSVPLREYDYYLLLAVIGTGIFVGGGVVAEIAAPTIVHWIHGVGAALIIIGLYRLPAATAQRSSWFDILVRNPRQARRQEEWMSPADDRILEVCATADLVLTPSIIAYNIEYSREEINRRLSELERHSLVERVERGKYRITDRGHRYLNNSLYTG
jgi:predicted transcriptional regulator